MATATSKKIVTGAVAPAAKTTNTAKAAPAKKIAVKPAAPTTALVIKVSGTKAKTTTKTIAAPAKKIVAKKAAVKTVAAPAKSAVAGKPTVVKTAAAAPAAKKATANAVLAVLKPIKTAFNKTSLVAHLAGHAGVEPKAAKALMASLEATIFASVNKKGLGSFTLPGLLKVTVHAKPAVKAHMGFDKFKKIERMFPAKKASAKIKTRALKKLKDAAL